MTIPDTIAVTVNNQAYTVILTARKASRRLTLRIDNKTGHPHLSHPVGYTRRKMVQFLENHKEWIHRHVRNVPEKIVFAPDGTILFEGQEFHLIHIPTPRGIHVEEDGENQTLTVHCPKERFGRAIEMFLKKEAEQAVQYLARRKAEILGKQIAAIAVRDTKSRWGSCTSKGKLSFSWRLIMAPDYVLDYLVAHEVAHLQHMDHSQQFWKTCANLSHDMTKAKLWLRKSGNHLHRFCAK